MSREPVSAGLLIGYFLLLANVIGALMMAFTRSFWVVQIVAMVLTVTLVLAVLAPRFGLRLGLRDQLRRGDAGLWLSALIWGVGAIVFRLAWVFSTTSIYDRLGVERPIPVPPSPETAVDGIALVAAVVLCAPVLEELLFRGAILGLFRKWGSRWALVGSAVACAWLHGSLFRFFPDMILGLLLGIIVLRTGNLTLAIALHMLNNAMATGAGQMTGWLLTSSAVYSYMPLILWGLTLLWLGAFRKRFQVLRQWAAGVWHSGEERVPLGSGVRTLLSHPVYKVLLVMLILQTAFELAGLLGLISLPA